ncbi:PHA/PHB synthase family protein [Flexivirga caeni]|uniref:Alpha/beta fold hydrolase n=1 Tax=Flexivirga caeni TaxID=2294115 RepID=A0A3M9MIX3_9MICO|nr:alpha/beta fold hydrolase [Flexivirga caeni]RNI25145.1 alpha/beta fold hydrolase [Flexivirga caeni]
MKETPFDDLPDEGGAALDLLLTEAATGIWRRFMPNGSTLKLATSVGRHPDQVARTVMGAAKEYAKIARGRSQVVPGKSDRRFSEPGWTDNSLLRAILQGYLVTSDAATRVVESADLDERDRERVEFVLENLIDALAPNNLPTLNPLWWKALIDTGGKSVLRGAKHFAQDMMSAPRVPQMVDVRPFQVGHNIAATRGGVVLRTPQFELIHYYPRAPEVARTPLLIVPPVINKFYVVDLSPHRSMVEYLLDQGQQVFAISWRNPDVRHRDWGFDIYGTAVRSAIGAVLAITDSPSTHMMSMCSGAALSSMLAAHMVAIGEGDKIATFSMGVAVLDQSGGGTVNSLADEKTARRAVKSSATKGYLDGASLSEIFAWLRPNDLIWNYWVNNYLQGRKPAAFDILFWNADATRMSAKLHADFINLFVDNKLVQPGAGMMLGTPVDLSTVKADSYIVAGIADHICPWQSCYASTQLLGGDARFILSRSGHVACLVNPPGNPKATYRAGESGTNPEDANEWLENATTVQGSWWGDYAAWLSARGGGRRVAPTDVGNEDFPVVDTAPGSYVFDK